MLPASGGPDMPLIITASDDEFAAATGSNVDVTSETSIFDYPPSAYRGLTITAQEGDADPRTFELGSTYDLAWGGDGGPNAITDAVVIRSDRAEVDDGSGGAIGLGGIVVFEGTDAYGNLTQIIWTPDFNLESWYAANYDPNALPEFYTIDHSPNYDHRYVCFASETLIATPHGPVRAADIDPGDRVDTLDAGPCAVRWVGRCRMTGRGDCAPVRFAPGALGNAAPLRVSQNHRVMVRDVRADLYFGSGEVLVPAKTLVNGTTIRFAPCEEVTWVHILLDTHQVVLAEGVPCESLFLGEVAVQLLESGDPDAALHHALRHNRIFHDAPARPMLSVAEARALELAPVLPPRQAAL